MISTAEQAVIIKSVWKSPELDRYAEGLLTAALKRWDAGVVYFNNDDVPTAYQPLDKSTVGCVFKQLQVSHIIEPWRGNIPELGIWGGMRQSTRACCNGHRNPTWTLTSRSLAEEWLRRHGVAVEERQPELFANASLHRTEPAAGSGTVRGLVGASESDPKKD